VPTSEPSSQPAPSVRRDWRRRQVDSESTPLARLREATGLTGAEVAVQVGIAKTTFYKWERGECVPSVAVVPPLAAALGISVEQLVAALTSDGLPITPALRSMVRIDLRRHGHQPNPITPTDQPED
jgi:transcriptional regulator with XRE-family HTH domain